MERPRRVPIVKIKTITPGDLTVKNVRNIDLMIDIILRIEESLIMIPHAMNTRIINGTMIGVHTITMTMDVPRTRTKARTLRNVVTRHIMLMMWRMENQ